MLLRYFYNEKLAHASYLVGCQKTGEAIIVDPARDLEPYFEVAKKEGMQIKAAVETHIHADYVSGARELGEVHQAKLYLSGEGGEEWGYQYVERIEHELLFNGDQFNIGYLIFEVMHTPGHTPESISLLLTDRGGNADLPMGIFSGDFVFVGDIGRPDLLESALGQEGSTLANAKAMFNSLATFKQLPDYLQVWPAHGAGSACGKALGAVPSSTVGYEKAFNWALSITDEDAFCKELLADQPEPPTYFKVMKEVNRKGPALLKDLKKPQEIKSAQKMIELLNQNLQIIDTRQSSEFQKKHIEHTINIPYYKSFPNWAGWLVDYERPLYLICDTSELENILHALNSVGIDQIAGYMDSQVVHSSDLFVLESYEDVTPSDIRVKVEKGEVHVLDVRQVSELKEGFIPHSQLIMLGTLAERLDELPTDKPILTQCRTGIRSNIAASILQANGIKNVLNLNGGIVHWQKEGLSTLKNKQNA
ncbi:MBL fold metallo-hydrolase [Metabacillus arenae]|uniref:MBL fold metallo-hydrolase n=1 Tax=Metabacillus arenae TaxID=2771434 RepID=A0A926NIP6_9BACI|nr:MBL fold metallo-hydrolase [Metabacillus arenae]MBD1381790.1 MBL fold metallo-hydrolase [Metabacillus arenae]